VGRHQLRNLALAITAAEQLNQCGFRILPQHIAEGVRDTRWPGRFQVIPAEGGFPETVLDVAHNPSGAWALRSTLSSFYEDRRLTFVFGAMRDKAIAEIASILFPLTERVIVTRPDNPRAAAAHEIAELAAPTQTEILEEENIPAALDKAKVKALAGGDGVIVITGSIYLVGKAVEILQAGRVRERV
jgi:dihydrofolate synthase/folylpolyglutamate synthase